MLRTFPLETKVGDVFPDAPPDKAAITVEQLLRHQSGLPDSIGLDETLIKRPFFLRKLWSTPLGKPGYSNAGYSLLAAMLEVRTGKSYDELVPATISYRRRDPLARGTWHGLAWGSTADYFGIDGPSWFLRGAGGLLASVHELDRWFAELWRGGLLNPELTARPLARRDRRVRAADDIVTLSREDGEGSRSSPQSA